MRRLFTFPLLAILLAGTSSVTLAQRINVDLNTQPKNETEPTATFEGPAAVGEAGDVWNGVTYESRQASATALVDSKGEATKVGVKIEGGRGQAAKAKKNALLSDFVMSGKQGRFTISGLEPGQAYELYLYGANPAKRGATFSVGEETKKTAGTIGSGFEDGASYVVFKVTAGSDGAISGTWSSPADDGKPGILNGLQIVKVETQG